MERKRNTKARMVRVAGRLFQERGYSGTGLAQILDASEAPRGSMYFHFPGGKQELAVKVIGHSAEALARLLDPLADPSSDLAEELHRIVQVFIDQLESTEFRRGCPVGNVALDVSFDDNPVRTACAAAFKTWQAKLEAALRGRVTEPEAAAVSILSLLEGALLLSKTQRDITPLVVAQATLDKLLQAYGAK